MNRLELYTRASEQAASVIINEYSTSFRLASRLLAEPVRQRVANIYALVRLADEIVDGATDGAGLARDDAARALTELEDQTHAALESGYCTNPIVHAFATTARTTGISSELTQPFFESMRSDLHQTTYDRDGFQRYVYGSAEVIGLMCLHAFLAGQGRTADERQRMESGARALGAAFQKVNFLRDLADDYQRLGRSYFPGVDVAQFTEAAKFEILDDIEQDFSLSRSALPLLPPSSRKAVVLAHALFVELADRLYATPADRILTARVSVPNHVKLRLAASAYAGRMPRR
jgi:phytoene/squalene synthetase